MVPAYPTIHLRLLEGKMMRKSTVIASLTAAFAFVISPAL